MPSTRHDAIERLRDAATRVAGSYGLTIFDVQLRRESIGWVLRVVIDRPAPSDGAAGPVAEEPVGIGDCQHVSQDLSALLDVEEELSAGIDQTFTLEVSSPGLDRPLRGEADYRRFVGRLAKITTREPVNGQSHFAGRLAGVEDGEVLMAEGRRTHRVPLGLISRARLEVEF
ncbi:MAG: ribosome maturation factor RimP [Vicinamibacterales bacterium]